MSTFVAADRLTDREAVPAKADVAAGSEHPAENGVAAQELHQESGPAEQALQQGSGSLPPLQKLKVLPLMESSSNLHGKTRQECIMPELLRKQEVQEIIRPGDVIRQENFEFVVVRTEPPEGPFGFDTDCFCDGNPIVCFKKIWFSARGPTVMSEDEVFRECVTPLFEGDYRPYVACSSQRVRLFHFNQILQIGSILLQVEGTEPGGLGVITPETEIFANWDETPEFKKVHIVPFEDTLPRAYQFDIFHDYLKPYLRRNLLKKFQESELFTFHGVQFKMIACEPKVSGRIGKNTKIFCEGTLHPSLRNLLSPELLNRVSQLPPRLQTLLLNAQRTTRELEDTLMQQRGLVQEALQEIESFDWRPTTMSDENQKTCMICLNDFHDGDNCRRLPCRHMFHTSCVNEWLRRCTDCPICKDNVDRAIRHN